MKSLSRSVQRAGPTGCSHVRSFKIAPVRPLVAGWLPVAASFRTDVNDCGKINILVHPHPTDPYSKLVLVEAGSPPFPTAWKKPTKPTIMPLGFVG